MSTPSYSYQYGSNPPVDYPRLLVADTGPTNWIFADQEILAMSQIQTISCFVMQGPAGVSSTFGTASYLRTAAGLLDSIASNKARLAGALKVLDIGIDTTKVAAALKEQAQAYRDQEENNGAFAMVELVYDAFTARERTWKQFLRLYAN